MGASKVELLLLFFSMEHIGLGRRSDSTLSARETTVTPGRINIITSVRFSRLRRAAESRFEYRRPFSLTCNRRNTTLFSAQYNYYLQLVNSGHLLRGVYRNEVMGFLDLVPQASFGQGPFIFG